MSVLAEFGLPPAPEPLPGPVADSHTHLGITRIRSGLAESVSIAEAASVGVTHIVDIGVDVATSKAAIAAAAAYPGVVAAVALHPNDAAKTATQDGRGALAAQWRELRSLAETPGVRAIGETGLDYYRTTDPDGKAAQEESFRAHIEWAKELDLTLVIHDRDAHSDVLRVLDDAGAPQRVIMHCFSGDAAFAEQCVSRGFWLSFPGVVTFRNAGDLRAAAKVTPPDHILVETDAPFLTPSPQRGKPNAPYLLPHTVRFLAELLELGLPEFCDLLLANTFAAYGGPWGTHDG